MKSHAEWALFVLQSPNILFGERTTIRIRISSSTLSDITQSRLRMVLLTRVYLLCVLKMAGSVSSHAGAVTLLWCYFCFGGCDDACAIPLPERAISTAVCMPQNISKGHIKEFITNTFGMLSLQAMRERLRAMRERSHA